MIAMTEAIVENLSSIADVLAFLNQCATKRDRENSQLGARSDSEELVTTQSSIFSICWKIFGQGDQSQMLVP